MRVLENRFSIILVLWLFTANCYSQTGYVKITSEPTEAIIIVDDKQVGMTPKILELPIGKHNVRFKKEYYRSVDHTIMIEADIVSKLHIQLKRGPDWIEEKQKDVVLQKGFGNLTILTDIPNAEITIDGIKTESTSPLTVKKISAGPHVVSASLKGASAQQVVVIEPNKTKKVMLNLAPILNDLNNPKPDLSGTWIGRRKCFYLAGRPPEELFSGRPIKIELKQNGRTVNGLLQAFADDYNISAFKEDFIYDGRQVTGQAINASGAKINDYTHGDHRSYKFAFNLHLTENGNKLEGNFNLSNHSEGGFFVLERSGVNKKISDESSLGEKAKVYLIYSDRREFNKKNWYTYEYYLCKLTAKKPGSTDDNSINNVTYGHTQEEYDSGRLDHVCLELDPGKYNFSLNAHHSKKWATGIGPFKKYHHETVNSAHVDFVLNVNPGKTYITAAWSGGGNIRYRIGTK